MKKKKLVESKKVWASRSMMLVTVAVVLIVAVSWLVNHSKPGNVFDVTFLKKGMSYTEIVQRIGEPATDIGSGLHIFVYPLPDGRNLWLSFGDLDHLQAARIFDPKTKESQVLVD
jgi:hypothetical protein